MNKVKLVLGTMTFGESVFFPKVDEFVNVFLDAGYQEIDTAYVYNGGSSEELLGHVLPNLKKKYRIATKIHPRISGCLDGETARKQLTESLSRLSLPCVDIAYLHFPDPATPVVDVLKAMSKLHEEGKFVELGLSNFPAWMVADVWHICDSKGWVKPTVYEGIYNPLARKAEIELNDCLNCYGLRFYAYNPLAGGMLSGRYSKFNEEPTKGRFANRPNYKDRYWKKSFFDAVELIKTGVEEEGISIIEAVYRWLTFHSMLNGDRGDSIIIGASSVNHLKQNLSSVLSGPLSEELVSVFQEACEIAYSDSPNYFTLYKSL